MMGHFWRITQLRNLGEQSSRCVRTSKIHLDRAVKLLRSLIKIDMYMDTISRLKDSKACKQMKINDLPFILGGVLRASHPRAVIEQETKVLRRDK